MTIDTDVELSYWEGLRAYWRIYWPTQVAVLILVFLYAVVHSGRTAPVVALVFQVLLGAATLFALIPRIYSRPYRGFSLVILDPSGGAAARLTVAQRARVWWYLWWRQLVAGLIATFLAMPTNIVLGIMGLHVSGTILGLAGVLIIGPILMKMLIGNPFEDFRIEVRRA